MIEFSGWLDDATLLIKAAMVLWFASIGTAFLVNLSSSKFRFTLGMLLVVVCFAAAYANRDVRLLLTAVFALGVIDFVSIYVWRKPGLTWVNLLAGFLGVGFCIACLDSLVSSPPTSDRVWMLTHVTVVSALAGLSILTSFDMTLVSAPDQLKRQASSANVQQDGPLQRQFGCLHYACLALVVIEMVVVCSLFLGPGPRSRATGETLAAEYQLLSWIYAATVLMVFVTMWLVPYRVHLKGERLRATEWSTLTLTSWLCFVGLVLILLLPIDWPWEVAGPMLGIS